MAKYSIRDAKDSDLPGIVRLRNGITEFRPLEPAEYASFWNSLVRDNPCSIRKVLVTTDDRGEIIAHYAMIPFTFWKDGKKLTGGFLCQLMVHENYRKELIFPRMEMTFLREYKNLGIDFLFSLGNREKVVKAHLSFGFFKIGELPVYVRPYKSAGFMRAVIKGNALFSAVHPFCFVADRILRLRKYSHKGKVSVREVPAFDSGIDVFMAGLRHVFPYSAQRDTEVFRWRFAKGVAKDYLTFVAREHDEIVGYVVLRRMEMKNFDVLAIIDILFHPDRDDAGKALLQSVHERALHMGVDMSACLMNPMDPLCNLLKKCGYFKSPEYFSLFVHEPRRGGTHFREGTFHKWHITWFDFDAV